MQIFLDKTPANAEYGSSSYGSKLKRIMLIADKLELAETLQLELSYQGFQVSVIYDGLRGLFAIRQIVPDLVIISWLPHRLSGLEICHRLRLTQSNIPMILLTHENNVEQRIAGLQAGANDCLSPPFVKEEFFARIQSNLAFSKATPESSVLRCADLQLNRKTREVFRGDRFIQLTAREFDLLEYLMNHYFQVVTRIQILENVWGYDYFGNSNIIEVYIRYLRQKLENKSDTRLIHTVRSVGYILREGGGSV